MDYYAMQSGEVLNILKSSKDGLTGAFVEQNRKDYGENRLSAKKPKPFFKKLLSALSEPMMIILLFSMALAFTVNLFKTLGGGSGDFSECLGILLAVAISVSITLIMEGSSEKTFRSLSKIYDNVYVKVVRDGNVVVISQDAVVVGDVIILSAGDKIVADGRLIESDGLSVDESALTGESVPVKKNSGARLLVGVHLAERVNMVYSGTFVSTGNGKMVVTAVGDNTEIGRIADGLKDEKSIPSPLSQKLSALGKKITLMGVVCSVAVFVLSVVRLIVSGTVSFDGVQNLFISSVILIVAAVPEGLPTIVAVSLALNMIKLAKENALIKKMIATETTGAISVICSDKTGTLTLNKMSVERVCGNEFCENSQSLKKDVILKNFILNTTADVVKTKREYVYQGSGTECALIVAYMKNVSLDYQKLRRKYKIASREPFSSKTKIMKTEVVLDGVRTTYIKGAPEKVLPLCDLSIAQQNKINKGIETYQKQAKRVLCFAHGIDDGKVVFDGYAVLTDKIRPEVKKAVNECKSAGIKTMILTGDNHYTAYAVGIETGICSSPYQVLNASEIEGMDDETLIKILPKITVVARSTPSVKLRVVKALKQMGEVVAVTGDGINDAPAIKHADVGIAMGRTGAEITKETADVVLLDDSFSTIVKAVAFGRNVYRNLQRFIMFQLSVNVCALLFITVCAIFGVPSPFNTLQLLWINVIMDGPPALTLGLEKADGNFMQTKPIKRNQSIVSKKTFVRIAVGATYMATILLLQYFFNFMQVNPEEQTGTVFTLFITFQLFNAFNSRELGSKSVLSGMNKNKIMLLTFTVTFLLQVMIISFIPGFFGVSGMSFSAWVKTVSVAFSVISISELYKFIYRRTKLEKRVKKTNKNKAECVN